MKRRALYLMLFCFVILPRLNASFGESFLHSQETGAQWSGNYSLSAGMTLYKSILAIWGDDELIKYQESLITASEEQVRQGRLQAEAGEILRSDLLLLEAQLAVDRNNLTGTVISRKIQFNTLKMLLSIDPRQPISILTPDENTMDRIATLPTEESVLTRSLEALPDLQIYDHSINIAELDVKLSKSSYIPSLSLSASVGTGHSHYEQFGSQLSEQVGLNLTVPIFNRSTVQQSRIALQQAQRACAQAKISLKESIIENYNNVVSANSTFHVSHIKMETNDASYQSYTLLF